MSSWELDRSKYLFPKIYVLSWNSFDELLFLKQISLFPILSMLLEYRTALW
jgi:hypothetical protein